MFVIRHARAPSNITTEKIAPVAKNPYFAFCVLADGLLFFSNIRRFYMKLDKRFFLTALLSVGLSFGLAACSSDSNDETKPDDNNEVKELCGNGEIDADAGEVCDIGVDKIQHNGDDVMPNDATCEMYGEASSSDKGKTWVSGAPACAKDCKGFAKGTCQSKDEQEQEESEGVNGILKCGSDLAVSDNGATAQVTYEMGSTTADSGVKAAIVCSAPTAKIDAAIQSVQYVDAAEGSAQVSISAPTQPGDYACYVIVKAGDKGAVVCPLENGTPARAAGNISDITGSTKDYTVAAAEGVIATWNNFSDNNIATILTSEAGMLSQAGSDAAASLKFVMANSTVVDDYIIGSGQAAAGGSVITALKIGNKKVDTGFAQTKTTTADANSHLVISSDNMAGKTIKVVAKTGKQGGKYSVVAGTTEIIEDFASAEAFETATGTIPAETTTLYLYPWFEACANGSCGNLMIDSIVIE